MNHNRSYLISYLPIVSILLLMASMVFRYSIVQHYALCAFGVTYVLDYVVNRRWQGWHWQGYMSIFVTLIILWLLPPVWQLFDATSPTPYFRSYVEQSLPFLAVGVIGIFGTTDKLRLCHIAWVMLICGAFFTLYSIGYTYYIYPNWVRVDFHGAYNTAVPCLNSHMHRNMYLNTSIFLALATYKHLQYRWQKVLMAVLALLSAVGVVLGDGRIGLAVLLGSLVLAAFYYMPRRLNWLKVLAVLGAVGVVVVWVMTAAKMQPEVHANEPRPFVWQYATRMYLEHPILGRGMSSMDVDFAQGAMTDPVMKSRYVDYIISIFPHFADYEPSFKWIHPHNAFLQYGIAFGVVGFVVLLLLFVLPLTYPCRSGNRVALYLFCFAMLVQCMTDIIGPGINPLFHSAMLLVFYRSR